MRNLAVSGCFCSSQMRLSSSTAQIHISGKSMNCCWVFETDASKPRIDPNTYMDFAAVPRRRRDSSYPEYILSRPPLRHCSRLLVYVAVTEEIEKTIRREKLIRGVVGLGYLKYLVPPEKILRFIEGKLNLLARLPFYVSVDQKTYGRYGVLPTAHAPTPAQGGGQRLGP